MRRSTLAVALLLCLVSLGSVLAEEKWRPFEADGAIVDGRQGILQLSVNGRPWLVQIDAPRGGEKEKMRTSVEVKAPANPELLKGYPAVRFSIMLDERGRAAAPVEELTIFTPHGETRYGVYPQDFGEQPERKREEPRREADGRGPAIKLPGRVFVVGKISRYRKGEFTVQIPGGNLSAVLADGADVKAHITDKLTALSMLQKGDHVQVKGNYREVGTANAERISAELTRTLGGEPAAPKLPPKVAAVESAFGDKDDVVKPGEKFGVEEEDRPNPDEPQRAIILKVN